MSDNRRRGFPRIASAVYILVREVYGSAGSGEMEEEGARAYGSTSTSRWAYAGAKAMGESLALAYHRQRGLRSTIARLFNVAGPRQFDTYGMVLPRFAEIDKRKPDLSRSRRLIGFRPRFRLDDIVADVVADVRSGYAGGFIHKVTKEHKEEGLVIQ